MIQKNRIYVAVASLALLAGGIGMGYWWASDSSEAATAAATASNAGAPGQTGREVLYWYDPMVPDQRFDKPGKSPFMDMQLVPKYADEVRGRHQHRARHPPESRHQNRGGRA